MKLSYQILTGLIILMVAQFLSGLVSYVSSRKLAAAVEGVEQTEQVRIELRNVVAQIAEDQLGLYELALNASTAGAAQYEKGYQKLTEQLSRLRWLTANNPAQQRRVEGLEKVVLVRHVQTQAFLDLPLSSRRARALVAVSTSNAFGIDEVRADCAAMDAEEERLLAVRKETARRATRALFTVIASTTVMVVIGLVSILTTRHLLARLDAIVYGVEALGLGNLGHRIEVKGNDKVAMLGRAINAMSDQIRVTVETLRLSEEELQVSNVFHRVAERTAELADVNQSLLQKQQEIEMFVYSVSHDLRSPLVNLQGFSQELSHSSADMRALVEAADMPEQTRQELKRILSVEVEESVGFIKSGVMRLNTIIEALLRLSRAGRIEYTLCMVDVRALVKVVVDSMHGSISQKGTKVTISDLPPAYGDVQAVEQIFSNLISNALKYLADDRPGSIELGGAVRADGRVEYFVRDNGRGIKAAYHEKVFQLFQRVHPEAGPGEGLGLTVVRRVVERHGGTIWIESQDGVGTTFYFTLPSSPTALHETAA